MAMRGFPTRFPTGSRAFTKRLPLKAEETFLDGAFVLGIDEVEECGANPAAILGLAAQPAEDVIEEGWVTVWIADENTVFAMSPSAAPAEANRGVAYGVTKDSDGVWIVDFAKTGGDARVLVLDFVNDASRPGGLVFVKVLKANRQHNA